VTTTGQSDYVVLTPGQTALIGDILPTMVNPIPIRINVSSPTFILDLGDTTQLSVIATFPDRSTNDDQLDRPTDERS
jgi:hypothetical protein